MTLSMVIVLEDCGPGLPVSIESAERQTVAPAEVILVHAEGVDERVRRACRDLSARPGVRTVAVRGTTRGALVNAGIRESVGAGIALLEEGDRLDRRFCERALAEFERDDTIAAVCCWPSVRTGHLPAVWQRTPSPDVRTLVLRPQTAPRGGLLRRNLWEKIGPLDESLPALGLYEFWLRATASGHRVAVVEEPLLYRDVHTRFAAANAVEGQYADAMRAVVEKHRALFEEHVVDLLYERERSLEELVREHQRLVRRQDQAKAERDELRRRIGDLQDGLAAVGRAGLDWGDLRRTDPVSRDWGYDRGTPIDRYYIDRFLETHAADIGGVVLEVQEPDLSRKHGGGRIEHVDVVDLDPSNPRATITADLRDARAIPSETFDCIVLTQTIHVIDDMPAVAAECWRILKPGGVLLATVPCTSRVCLEYGDDGDFWRMTEAGARRLFSTAFSSDHIETRSYGNVLVNAAFLYGLGTHEVTPSEFDVHDPYFPLLVGVRAVKPAPQPDAHTEARAATRRTADPSLPRPAGGRPPASGAILLYHRVASPASDVHGLSIDPWLFREQMAYIARDCTPVSLPDLIAASRTGSIPPRAVAITFDDGYLDNLTAACPILQSLRLPATFFLTTDRLDEDREYWWDSIERVFIGAHDLPHTLDLAVEGEQVRCATRTAEERLSAHWSLYRALVRASLAERDGAVRTVLRWSGFDGSPWRDARPMRGAEIEALARLPGVTVGSHTVHHLALGFQSADIQRDEMARSRSELEALVGYPVTLLSFPYGHVGEASASIARLQGFDGCVTCQVGAVQAGSDVGLLPRLMVETWTVPEFASRLRSLFNAAGTPHPPQRPA
jgi:peptidoglycan/xylan/chitin deacetylase (PgdA/CDA1 family)/SAM-dependent methyltransferase